jgi:hypothetical protein
MDNKEHIRRFIDHVNELPAGKIDEAWEACGKAYKKKMEDQRTQIELNSDQSLLSVINDLVEEESVGQVQQPLCYAAIDTLYSRPIYTVETKRVYAGDDQSGVLGDIQVSDDLSDDGELRAVYEVKAHKVNAQKVRDVLDDHGAHDYSLTILAKEFETDVDQRANLVLGRIPDFIQTMVGTAALLHRMSAEEAARRTLEKYNEVMEEVEDRPEYQVDLEELTE